MKFSPTVLAAVTLFAASTAKAESWSCNYSPIAGGLSSYVGFSVKNDLLIDELYDTWYTLLENNQNALLAETHYADYDPVLTTITLFVETIMIDKTSRRLTVTTAVSGSDVKQAVGLCHTTTIDAIPVPNTLTSKVLPRSGPAMSIFQMPF